MTRSTANGVGRRHTVRCVRSRRQASTAMDMAPTSASDAARQAQARHAHSARAEGTRSKSAGRQSDSPNLQHADWASWCYPMTQRDDASPCLREGENSGA